MTDRFTRRAVRLAGKVPEPFPPFARAATHQEHAVAVPRHHGRLADLFRSPGCSHHWNLGDAAGGVRGAVAGQRTAAAERPIGRADHRAQVHQRLIEDARALPRHHRRGELPDRFVAGASNGLVVPREPCEHAARVGLHDRRGEVEGDRGDGAGGVAADPRQAQQAGNRPRKLRGVIRHHRLRRSMQLPGTAIVAEALPVLEHVGLAGGGELADGRKPRHESPVELLHPLHLRLLEHDLADPDGVGIARPPPG